MKAQRTSSLTLDTMEGYPVEDTVDECGVAGDSIDDGPHQVLDRSQKLHLLASILSIGERNHIDVCMSGSDTKIRGNFQIALRGPVAGVRVRRIGEMLRDHGFSRTLIHIHLEQCGEGG